MIEHSNWKHWVYYFANHAYPQCTVAWYIFQDGCHNSQLHSVYPFPVQRCLSVRKGARAGQTRHDRILNIHCSFQKTLCLPLALNGYTMLQCSFKLASGRNSNFKVTLHSIVHHLSSNHIPVCDFGWNAGFLTMCMSACSDRTDFLQFEALNVRITDNLKNKKSCLINTTARTRLKAIHQIDKWIKGDWMFSWMNFGSCSYLVKKRVLYYSTISHFTNVNALLAHKIQLLLRWNIPPEDSRVFQPQTVDIIKSNKCKIKEGCMTLAFQEKLYLYISFELSFCTCIGSLLDKKLLEKHFSSLHSRGI